MVLNIDQRCTQKSIKRVDRTFNENRLKVQPLIVFKNRSIYDAQVDRKYTSVDILWLIYFVTWQYICTTFS